MKIGSNEIPTSAEQKTCSGMFIMLVSGLHNTCNQLLYVTVKKKKFSGGMLQEKKNRQNFLLSLYVDDLDCSLFSLFYLCTFIAHTQLINTVCYNNTCWGFFCTSNQCIIRYLCFHRPGCCAKEPITKATSVSQVTAVERNNAAATTMNCGVREWQPTSLFIYTCPLFTQS